MENGLLVRLYLGGQNENGGIRQDRAEVEREVSPIFPGYTLIPAYGLWEGKIEETWIIELFIPGTWDISDPNDTPEGLDKLIFNLACKFHQNTIGRVGYTAMGEF